jgi:hypothetical protein
VLRIASGSVLLIAGVIWILQGFDAAFAPESFMTGDRFWSVAGAVAVVGGGGLIWWGIWARRRDD